jgi:hypothetical protein
MPALVIWQERLPPLHEETQVVVGQVRRRDAGEGLADRQLWTFTLKRNGPSGDEPVPGT